MARISLQFCLITWKLLRSSSLFTVVLYGFGYAVSEVKFG
jgi:hypothetical protein